MSASDIILREEYKKLKAKKDKENKQIEDIKSLLSKKIHVGNYMSAIKRLRSILSDE